ncbi:MAG: hypothetical protein A3H49_10605 [Nitrospirae bacterium RIFCSPLOWO2_02_FULL_62_14]|nr:MAG: hypothetical protein A3H49_10605 [Nitrospirae bacterium RIFCSPLOWO2_02_FULL_62_14]OGW68462.1 MAG: hypothetical protein A3A88_11115 [Nitrospirae bacterium RIFCSPLOWO2_01_FULL_62_17]
MRWMHPATMLIAVLGLLWGLHGCSVPPLMHRGGIMVDSWAEVKIDNASVAGILAAFNRAESALQAGKLDELMDLYSNGYSYHGLTKQELRKIWEELLQQHREFRSNHILSRFVAVPGEPQSAEVTCSGSLWAISKETGEQVNIDSWYGEVHHMVNENGMWRVRGHRGKAPKTQVFGAAPHPFF